jgi:signal transduction histidine kinase
MTRLPLVIVLLVATLGISAWMAMRAQYAAREHQRTAENVVRDWTRVAGDELLRRTDLQAAIYGTYNMLRIVSASKTLQTPRTLMDDAKTDEQRRNAGVVLTTFRYDGHTLQSSGELPPLQRTLDALLAHPPAMADQKPFYIGNRVFAYTITNGTIDGFEVNRLAFDPFFKLSLQIRPLLPRSLANGKITNDKVHARAVDPRGRVLFTTGGPVDPPLAVRVDGDQDGLLRGVFVDASLAPETTSLIVAGGIPRTLPIYIVLLAISGALLIAAILQVGRERALARMRSDFVAGVSHELRTPLTQIRMFAETLLLDRIRSDDERKRSLAIIDQESRRLGQLVENVLQFSRGERGKLRIAPQRIDAGAIVREAVESFLPLATSRGMRIVTNIEDGAIAELDHDAIRQVVLNLLDNAAKYGPDGQTIRVEVVGSRRVVASSRRQETTALLDDSKTRRPVDSIRIIVEDEGPGIPAHQRKRIWRRYARLPRERERAIAGAGIGLAVVRDLVRLHGGRAWCENTEGGGARFIVEVDSDAVARFPGSSVPRRSGATEEPTNRATEEPLP